MSEKMVSNCIAELRYKSIDFKSTGFVTTYDGGIFKSDSVIPESLNEALRTEVAAKLGDVRIPSQQQKDWHPGSDGKVLDLVHPSLFPLVYGRSRILPEGSVTSIQDCIWRCGEGIVIPVPDPEETVVDGYGPFKALSSKFQWLPANFKFENGGGVRCSFKT